MSDKEIKLSSSVNFDPALLERAKEIKENATVDPTTGNITVAKGFFQGKIEKVVSLDTYTAIMAERDLNVNAANLAFSELAVQMLANNKDLQRCELYVPTIGRGYMEGVINRDYTMPDRDNPGQTKVGYGKLAMVTFHDHSSRGAGEMKNIKRHLGEIARANLANLSD